MRKHKQEFILIAMVLFTSSLLTVFVFGQNYTSEPADRTSKPSRPATAKTPPRAKRSVTIYSTEDVADSPSRTDSNATTTSTRDHKVHRTRTIPRRPETPNRPESPNSPKSPDTAKAADYGDYPAVDGGTINLHSYPYFADRDSYQNSNGDYGGGFWPWILGIDLSYSWFGGSGGGEFAYCGYRYSWGDNPAYSDASGDYQIHSAMESDPNTTNGNYTTDSTKGARSSDCRHRPSPPNEPLPDAPVSDAAEKPEPQASRDK